MSLIKFLSDIEFLQAIKTFYHRYFFSDLFVIKMRFLLRQKRLLNLKNPQYYNDKIQWLKINWYDKYVEKCVDKYEVRDIIKNKIGEQYLNELIGVYDSVDEINFDVLPDKFVLKCTHASGFNIICSDKNKLNIKKTVKRLRRWMKTNYFWYSKEWQYKNLKPKIVCERFLTDGDGKPPKDYKIFCFDGKAKFLEVDFDRFGNHRTNFYDLDWNLMDISFRYPPDKSAKVQKPEKFDEMIKLANIMSDDFPHARVDFYYVGDKIYFGELTFFHGGGTHVIKPKEFELEIGKWIKLPEKK